MLVRTLILSGAAALALAAGSIPARADWHGDRGWHGGWHGDGGGWRGREWHGRDWHGDWHGDWGRPGPYQPWVYAAPPVYAPPPVYAAPPPAYYAPPPGVSFNFGW